MQNTISFVCIYGFHAAFMEKTLDESLEENEECGEEKKD